MSDWDNYSNWWSQVRAWWDTSMATSGKSVGGRPVPFGGKPAPPGWEQQDPVYKFGNWLQSQFTGGGAAPPAGSPGSPGTTPGQTDLQSLYQQLYQQQQAAASAASAPAGYYTPDGVWIADNSPQDAYYRMVDAIWTKIYGQHPPYSMVQTFHDLGVENTSQLDTIMKQMPSHITNPDGSKMPIGQYDVMKGTAETFSDKYFGRPIPDQLIQDWVKAGITDPESIELWFLNHPAKDIPKDVYGKIFDAAAAQVKDTWNDLPHPDTVSAIHQNLAASAATGTAYLP